MSSAALPMPIGDEVLEEVLAEGLETYRMEAEDVNAEVPVLRLVYDFNSVIIAAPRTDTWCRNALFLAAQEWHFAPQIAGFLWGAAMINTTAEFKLKYKAETDFALEIALPAQQHYGYLAAPSSVPANARALRAFWEALPAPRSYQC